MRRPPRSPLFPYTTLFRSITVGTTAASFAASVNAANIGVTATVVSSKLVFTATTRGATSTIGAITASASLLTDLGIGSGTWTATAAGVDEAGCLLAYAETATHALSFSATTAALT